CRADTITTDCRKKARGERKEHSIMPGYEREQYNGEWDHRARPRARDGSEREDQRRDQERQDYSEDYGGHDWEPPAYGWRQQSYPWGHQGQEGYFGSGEPDYDRTLR